MANPVPTVPPVPSNPVPAPQALSEAAALMLQQFKMLDPQRAAVGLDKLRPFYPRVGWDKILATVHELEEAGKLTKKAVMNSKGGVGYHVYTWAEG